MAQKHSPRITPLPEQHAHGEIKIAYNQHKQLYGARITNMKATLGHSYTAFQTYMQWYPLYEEIKPLLGKRLASLFAWSISEASDCPLCSTYFRKVIIESGEDPEQLQLTPEEQVILSFGAAIGRDKGNVPDEIFLPIRARFSDRQLVTLIAFAGIMVATNIFNNVVHTEIDQYLHPFLPPSEVEVKSF